MRYYLYVMLFFLAIACNPYEPEEKVKVVEKDSLREVEAAKQILGCYEGLLPCADCEGIHTVLTLRKDGKYLLEERFTGGNGEVEKTFTYQGDYKTLKGTDKDPEAVIYQLVFAEKEHSRNFLVTSKSAVKLVDPKYNEFDNDRNYILKMVKNRKKRA